MDGIPRKEENVEEIVAAANKVVGPLIQLKERTGDVFADVDVEELRNQAEELLLVVSPRMMSNDVTRGGGSGV